MKIVILKKSYVLFFTLVFLTLTSWSTVLQPRLKLQGDTLNFEISGQKNWDYDLKKIKDKSQIKVQLSLKGIDQNSLSKIKNVANNFVKSIAVLPNQVDGMSIIEFVLKDESIEAFDYLTEQPSKLVVDFYQQEENLKTEDNKLNQFKGNGSNTPKTAQLKNESKRKPAQVDNLQIDNQNNGFGLIVNEKDSGIRSGLFDGADEKFDRFKLGFIDSKLIQSQKDMVDYYLRFPLVEREFDFWTSMKNNTPEYNFIKKETEEYKQAKLLKILFDKKRYLMLRKTSDWFEKKFKQSEYLENIYFMNADAMFKMYQETRNVKYYDEALSFYAKAIQRFPNSILKERTMLFVAMMRVERQDYLSAVRNLEGHIYNPEFKNKPSAEYAKLALAYSLAKLNKLDDALKILDGLEQTAKSNLIKADAGLRRGDFYSQSQQYEKAAEAYSKALTKYEKESELYPGSYFNFSEVLFRNKKPEQAHAAALNFVKKFPSHEYAPYALTRVGELLEILGSEQSKAVGAYLETHFRYGDNPRTIIARLHLLSTRMKVMKEQEVNETLTKMDELAKKSELANIDQFKTTMISDGFYKRNEYQKALDQLISFYQKEPNKPDSSQIVLRIAKNINALIKEQLNNDDYKSVLNTYKKYADTWIKNQPRIDTDFYIAKAYQKAGAYGVALKKIQKIYDQLENVSTQAEFSKIKSTQNLPSFDELNLMTALCLYEEGQYQESYDKMKQIAKPQALSVQDQVNRIYYTALMSERKGDYTNSIRYLTEAVREWSNKPELLAPSLLKLSDLENKRNNFAAAKSYLMNIVQNNVLADYKLTAYKKLIDLSVQQKNKEDTKLYLTEILTKFESSHDLATERYKLGELFFNDGEIQKASNVWSDLKGDSSLIWSKLAQNKLNDVKWKDENNKYLKRIPAVSKSENNTENTQ